MATAIKGKDGWLFLDNDTNRVVEQITGRIPASKMDWEKVAKFMAERVNLSKIYGFKYLFLIAPNAHCFAREYLPDNIKISDDRTAIYMEKLFPDITIYPLELLRANRDKYDLYYKTDTHWTQISVVLVFNEISKKLGLGTIVDISGPYEEVKNYGGDLGNRFYPKITCNYKKLSTKFNVEVVSKNNVVNTGNFEHFRSNNKNGKRCVIFGDSYLHDFLDVIACYFEEVFYFWQAGIFDSNVIRLLHPDVVINETAERFFNGEIDDRSYYDVLMDKIMISGDDKLKEIDLRDDFYSESFRKMFRNYILARSTQKNFLFLGSANVGEKSEEPIFLYKNIVLEKKNSNYNLYRYDIPQKRGIYNIVLEDIEAEFNEYTIGVYDFEKDKILHFENCSVKENQCFSFALGDEEKLSFIFYTGIYGHTANQYMKVGAFRVYYTGYDE